MPAPAARAEARSPAQQTKKSKAKRYGIVCLTPSRPISRLTPQPTERGRAEWLPLKREGREGKDCSGFVGLATLFFLLKEKIANHKEIFDEYISKILRPVYSGGSIGPARGHASVRGSMPPGALAGSRFPAFCGAVVFDGFNQAAGSAVLCSAAPQSFGQLYKTLLPLPRMVRRLPLGDWETRRIRNDCWAAPRRRPGQSARRFAPRNHSSGSISLRSQRVRRCRASEALAGSR